MPTCKECYLEDIMGMKCVMVTMSGDFCVVVSREYLPCMDDAEGKETP